MRTHQEEGFVGHVCLAVPSLPWIIHETKNGCLLWSQALGLLICL